MNLDGLTILVLEDEPIIAMALEEQLEETGARPVVVGSLEAAHAVLEDGRFNAAILDINVHGGKSYPVAQRLSALGVPFVFASGYGDTLNPDEFKSVPTVTKPYDIAALTRALEAARPG